MISKMFTSFPYKLHNAHTVYSLSLVYYCLLNNALFFFEVEIFSFTTVEAILTLVLV